MQKQLHILQQIIYHIDNLARVSIETCDWSQSEREILQRTIHSIIAILRNRCNEIDEEHFKLIAELDKQFWSYKNDLKDYKPNHYHHHFSSESIILFEVLSIHDMLEELKQLKQISEKYEWEKPIQLISSFYCGGGDNMTLYIALLRGINVGGHKVIKMADLKRVFESKGLKQVKTYIQSGNIVFESEEGINFLKDRIQSEIKKRI